MAALFDGGGCEAALDGGGRFLPEESEGRGEGRGGGVGERLRSLKGVIEPPKLPLSSPSSLSMFYNDNSLCLCVI